MNRKLIFLSIISIFVLTWGMSGFASAATQREESVQSGIPFAFSTPVATKAAGLAGIPVTAEPRFGWVIFVFYGLIGCAALTLILALLDSANRSTSFHVRRKTMREESPNDNG
jgi:Trk-type K+ transport system membrane component